MPRKRKACPSSFDKAYMKIGRPSKDRCIIENAAELVSSSFKELFWMTLCWVLMLCIDSWRTQNIFGRVLQFCTTKPYPGIMQQGVSTCPSASSPFQRMISSSPFKDQQLSDWQAPSNTCFASQSQRMGQEPLMMIGKMARLRVLLRSGATARYRAERRRPAPGSH